MSSRGRSTVEEQEQEQGDGHGHGHGHDLDDGDDGTHQVHRTHQVHQEEREDGCFSSSKRTKRLLLVPFTRLESLYRHNKKKKKKKKEKSWWWRWRAPPPVPFPYSEDMGKDCCYCFMRPPAPPASPMMPPYSKATPGHVSYTEFVKAMIEANDFYSPDCNPHLKPKS